MNIIKIILGASALWAFPAMAQRPDLNAQINGNLAYGTITGLGTRDIREVIMTIINVIFGFLSAIFVVILMFGVFQLMTSGGSEDKADQAKKYIVGAIVGLAIMFVSYAISLFVVRSLVNVST